MSFTIPFQIFLEAFKVNFFKLPFLEEKNYIHSTLLYGFGKTFKHNNILRSLHQYNRIILKLYLPILLSASTRVLSPSLPWKDWGGSRVMLFPCRLISFRIFRSEKAFSWRDWMLQFLKLIFWRWFSPRELKMFFGSSFM